MLLLKADIVVFFESVKDGIIIFDAESGVILDANPYLLGLLGYERKQLINKEIWEVRPFNKILEDRDEFTGLQEKDAIRYKNLSLQILDKRLIAMEYSCNKYVVDEHKVVQCNFRDITDRKEAEESVKNGLLSWKRSIPSHQLCALLKLRREC